MALQTHRSLQAHSRLQREKTGLSHRSQITRRVEVAAPQASAKSHAGVPAAAPRSQPRPLRHIATASAASSTAIAVNRYLEKGPHGHTKLPPISFLLGQGNSGPLDCTLNVFLPAPADPSVQQRWPLLVFSAGFLLHSGLYGSYAADLASWGIAVALYDLPEVVPDTSMVNAITNVINTCTSDPRVAPHVDPRAVLLGGHSRGGKLSVLAAAGDPRVKGVALLDPVDVTAMTPMGPDYPSALPAMRVACGPPRRMPTLIVGAGLNADVIPADGNYKRFMTACSGPCWAVELQGAGHLQFLDAQVGLFSMFTKPGPTPDEAVRAASKGALAAWALELAVPLARGEQVNGQQAAQRLQQTSTALERRAALTYTIKGFEALGGYTYSGAGGPHSGAGSSGAASASSGGRSSGSGACAGKASCATEGSRGASSASSSSYASSSGGRASSGSAAASSSSASASSGGGGSKYSYEQLMGMRAKELKAILVAARVDCSDCFEKEDLARRIMQRCNT
ncbi:hypothetical protein HYH03_006692 [Edaphochlamys debaryana]|uniref:Chlorophyllase n=1 Tax=Edaphochlamys debaryana TaxID=47281 RepID=A0A835Y6I4_9CHLO|nr:hypothetical protein HYH03_006692 [Edaphochlamys debaryana]|eukprot:KAG2495081.1 hypothetical protein HYH03_006692 [Edaphochlamys debaryana]